MNEFGAHERGALVATWLITEGPQRVQVLTPRLYETDTNSTYNLLNNVSRAIPLVNCDGWWYLNLAHVLLDLPLLVAAVEERLAETPEGIAFARPFKRYELVRLRNVLRHMYKIGTAPPP